VEEVTPMPELKPGSAAPKFKVKDQDGVEHTLDEAKGKSLVLWFYPRADTPG
jgi:peroxiredoxin Q/BCP